MIDNIVLFPETIRETMRREIQDLIRDTKAAMVVYDQLVQEAVQLGEYPEGFEERFSEVLHPVMEHVRKLDTIGGIHKLPNAGSGALLILLGVAKGLI